MSTLSEGIDSVKAQIDALITDANETTGKSDSTIGDAVKSLKDGYGGGTPSHNLPPEYTELSYIENTGSAYIDTGISPTISTEVNFKWIKRWPQAEEYASPFGVTGVTIFFGYQTQTKNSSMHTITNTGYFSFGNVSDALGMSPFNQISADRFLFNRYGSAVINDDNTASFKVTTWDVTSFTESSYTMFVFGRNNSGTPNRRCLCAIYDFIINDISTGETLWHGIPCKRKSDGLYGFYDIINNAFHGALGTTTDMIGE